MMLRLYSPIDLPMLLRIENAVHETPWTEETFTICLNAGCAGWVIELNAKIIGFIICGMQTGECHILNLCVDTPYQHQGWGRKLLTIALQIATQAKMGIAYLEVRRSNKKAIALYQKFNFKQIGERKNYYPSTDINKAEDALIFAKSLVVD